MDKNVIVPLALFAAVVYVVKLLLDARMRWLFFKAGAPDTVQALFHGEEQLRRMSSLRWGLVLCALGLALALAGAMQWPALSLPMLATLLLGLGLGNLAAFFAARRLDRGA